MRYDWHARYSSDGFLLFIQSALHIHGFQQNDVDPDAELPAVVSAPVPEQRTGWAAEVSVLQLPHEAPGSVEDANTDQRGVGGQCIAYRRRRRARPSEAFIDTSEGLRVAGEHAP